MNWNIYFKEFRYNIRLAYPIILAMLGHTVVGVVDNILVGKIGATELAAASLANSFVFIGISIGVGFSTAITPLVAVADSENNFEDGRKTFMNGLFLCILMGLILFFGLYFFKPLIRYMNQPEEVIVLAKPFLDIVAMSLIPLVIYQAFKQFSDGKSKTKNAMFATIIANLVNVFLSYVLIHGVWIFPKMGMMGAAYGTFIARICMLIYMYFAMRSQMVFKPFLERISFKEMDFGFMKKITSIGLPSSMQSFFEVGLFTAAVWLSGMLGTVSQAANQIALSMASMTFMFASGLSVAAMIRVGNQRGLKNYPQLQIVAKSIMLMTAMLYTFFALFFVIFHKYIPLLFLDGADLMNAEMNNEVIALAGKLLLIAAIFQISDGLQVTILGSLRGLQDVNIPMIGCFISYWIIGFPVALVLGLQTSLGAQGIWYGLLAGLTASAIFSYLRFNYLTQKLIKTSSDLATI